MFSPVFKEFVVSNYILYFLCILLPCLLFSTTSLLCSYTGLLGEDELKIEFLDSAGKRVAARTELYNLDKGLSLCRYRVYREAEGVTLSVKLHNKHVKSSPFKIRAVQSEDCHCPHRSVDQWLADFQCPSTHKQVESDLTQFQAGGILLNGLYERTAERFPRTSFVHYSIIRNKVVLLFYFQLSCPTTCK